MRAIPLKDKEYKDALKSYRDEILLLDREIPKRAGRSWKNYLSTSQIKQSAFFLTNKKSRRPSKNFGQNLESEIFLEPPLQKWMVKTFRIITEEAAGEGLVREQTSGC